MIWVLVDACSSLTTLLDRDARLFSIAPDLLIPSQLPIVGIGGSVRSFLLKGAEIILTSDEGDFVLQQDLWVVQHDLEQLPPEEVARILRLPSVLGRDLINRFVLTCDYKTGVVKLRR